MITSRFSPPLAVDDVVATRADRLDRASSRLVALGGLGFSAIWVVDEVNRDAAHAEIWRCGFGVLIALLALAAAAPKQLDHLQMRAIWIAIPTLGAILLATTFSAGRGFDGIEVWDTSWLLVAVYLCFLVLGVRGPHPLVRINLFAAVFAVLPALTYLWRFGSFEVWMPGMTAVIFSNVGYAMLLALFRRRMLAYYTVQERWRQRVLASAASEARLREERELARLAHDRVLGTLNAAAMWDGAVSPELREMAGDAIALLEARSGSTSSDQLTDKVSATVAKTAIALDPDCELDLASDGAAIPTECAVAIVDATSEALRNSVRHAPNAHRRLSALMSGDRVVVTIADDGDGFAPESVSNDRLGIANSIITRIHDLPGGEAQVHSRPGAGTLVHLTWTRKA